MFLVDGTPKISTALARTCAVLFLFLLLILDREPGDWDAQRGSRFARKRPDWQPGRLRGNIQVRLTP
jgi:hypothetical protein